MDGVVGSGAGHRTGQATWLAIGLKSLSWHSDETDSGIGPGLVLW